MTETTTRLFHDIVKPVLSEALADPTAMSLDDTFGAIQRATYEALEQAQKQEWTTSKPTKEGWYWIWTTSVYDERVVYCIQVIFALNGSINFAYPCGGYEWEPDFRVENTTHWMGPLSVPALPVVKA